ncbi:MAG: hypothetical protein ACREXR_17740 [Gammaproteobacteria bacterium]
MGLVFSRSGDRHDNRLADYESLIGAAPADRRGRNAVEAGQIGGMWRASRTAMHQPVSVKTTAALNG